LPDTQHQVLISSDASPSSASANIEFRTLAIPCPTNLRLQKTPSSAADVFATLLWQPVANTSTENVVGGYTVYADGQLIHQILDPAGETLNLGRSTHLPTSLCLFLANMLDLRYGIVPRGASYLTLRTLSGDGNLESAHSERVFLPDQHQKDSLSKV
jgi:hypothetical protein